MKTIAVIALFALGACSTSYGTPGTGAATSKPIDEIYPASAAECPVNTFYQTFPAWRDQSGENGSPSYSWCHELKPNVTG